MNGKSGSIGATLAETQVPVSRGMHRSARTISALSAQPGTVKSPKSQARGALSARRPHPRRDTIGRCPAFFPQLRDVVESRAEHEQAPPRIKRRHLNESQRAMVAARLATLKLGGDRRSDQAAKLPVVLQPAASALLNVGERTVRSARVVLDEGVPALIKAVERGEVSVSDAARVSTLEAREAA